jgi:hypothetical protein
LTNHHTSLFFLQPIQLAVARIAMEVVSHEPLIMCYHDFLSQAECQALSSAAWTISRPVPMPNQPLKLVGSVASSMSQLSSDTQQLLLDIERRIGELADTPPHDGETSLVFNTTLSYVPAHADSDASWAAVDQGLHVDTQNNRPRRFVTAIIYLNTLEQLEGGATVFPCAGLAHDSPALAAAHSLLEHGIEHSLSPKVQLSECHMHAVRQLEAAVRNNQGVRTQPTQGMMVWFYSRHTHDGSDCASIDAHSWHAGMNVLGKHTTKITLQKFKEIPDSVPSSELRQYVDARRQRNLSSHVATAR